MSQSAVRTKAQPAIEEAAAAAAAAAARGMNASHIDQLCVLTSTLSLSSGFSVYVRTYVVSKLRTS